MDVPVQYFQSVIAVETAVTGVLLFQIRFFATNKDAPTDAPQASDVDPRLRVLLLIVLTATVFGSLEAIREGRGRWSAVLVTVGLAVSVLPILLRVLPRPTLHPSDPRTAGHRLLVPTLRNAAAEHPKARSKLRERSVGRHGVHSGHSSPFVL